MFAYALGLEQVTGFQAMAKFGSRQDKNTIFGPVALPLQADNDTLLNLWVIQHEVTESAEMIGILWL